MKSFDQWTRDLARSQQKESEITFPPPSDFKEVVWKPLLPWTGPKPVDINDETTWPVGLDYSFSEKRWEFKCERCKTISEWFGEPENFVLGEHTNLCGRSQWCCP